MGAMGGWRVEEMWLVCKMKKRSKLRKQKSKNNFKKAIRPPLIHFLHVCCNSLLSQAVITHHSL